MANVNHTFASMSADEREKNLRLAAALRAHRAEVRRALKHGEIGIDEALGDPKCGGMRLRQLLSALPHWGVKTAREWMEANGINYAMRVRGLGVHQRELVASIGRE